MEFHFQGERLNRRIFVQSLLKYFPPENMRTDANRRELKRTKANSNIWTAGLGRVLMGSRGRVDDAQVYEGK